MSVLSLFATEVYVAPLLRTGLVPFNTRLLRECLQLRADDVAGQRWSVRNYPGGFTSYGSQCRMHRISPTFAALEKRLARHVRAYAQALELDLEGRELAMTDCWVNIMPPLVAHSVHLHPLSTISGTYYVRTPRGAPALKFEDPRLDRFMAAPPSRAGSRPGRRGWFSVPARVGNVVLFESWLRHEVPPNTARGERVSISFNYSWF